MFIHKLIAATLHSSAISDVFTKFRVFNHTVRHALSGMKKYQIEFRIVVHFHLKTFEMVTDINLHIKEDVIKSEMAGLWK